MQCNIIIFTIPSANHVHAFAHGLETWPAEKEEEHIINSLSASFGAFTECSRNSPRGVDVTTLAVQW